MNYSDIKTFSERCEEHPDHQSGMVTERDIQRRLGEEIDELREYIEGKKWVGLTDDEKAYSNTDYAGKCAEAWQRGVGWAEAKLKEKNHDNND